MDIENVFQKATKEETIGKECFFCKAEHKPEYYKIYLLNNVPVFICRHCAIRLAYATQYIKGEKEDGSS